MTLVIKGKEIKGRDVLDLLAFFVKSVQAYEKGEFFGLGLEKHNAREIKQG